MVGLVTMSIRCLPYTLNMEACGEVLIETVFEHLFEAALDAALAYGMGLPKGEVQLNHHRTGVECLRARALADGYFHLGFVVLFLK